MQIEFYFHVYNFFLINRSLMLTVHPLVTNIMWIWDSHKTRCTQLLFTHNFFHFICFIPITTYLQHSSTTVLSRNTSRPSIVGISVYIAAGGNQHFLSRQDKRTIMNSPIITQQKYYLESQQTYKNENAEYLQVLIVPCLYFFVWLSENKVMIWY